jgi:transcriptional regulator with XRE-family HTH domain
MTEQAQHHPDARTASARSRARTQVMLSGSSRLPFVLRRLRTERGLSFRALSRRCGLSDPALWYLEHGRVRPRRSALRFIALGLDPDRADEITGDLVTAAGVDLAPDTDGTWRWRRRRYEACVLAGTAPLPADIQWRIDAFRVAGEARRRADALLWRGGGLDDAAGLAEAQRLLGVAQELEAKAGPPFTLRIGRHELRFGFGW